MKLLNYTTRYFAAFLFIIIAIWALIFYFRMLDEIYDSIDDGLENQKTVILQKIEESDSIPVITNIIGNQHRIREVPAGEVISKTDVYYDSLAYSQVEEDLEPVRVLQTFFRHDSQYFELLITTSMVEEDDLIENLLISLIALYIGLVAIILLTNNILLKKIWQPFYILLQKLGQFRLDKQEKVDLPKTPIDEFSLLNDTINNLLKKNIKIYNSQKQFIENAAHELQTPLAICQNKLEVLLERNDWAEEDLKVLSDIIDTLQRLTRLNKSLLLLSRIENKQFHDQQPVNISRLLAEVTQEYSDYAEFKNVTIKKDLTTHLMVDMNPDLSRVLLTNLVKNAVTHNKPGGRVEFVTSEKKLVLTNSGDQPLDEKRIFQRFYKGEIKSGSTGLGLAIVKAIVDYYGFQIRYSFDKEHIITINF